MPRAVGNDHFCDTTKRASQRLSPHIKVEIPLYHRSLDPTTLTVPHWWNRAYRLTYEIEQKHRLGELKADDVYSKEIRGRGRGWLTFIELPCLCAQMGESRTLGGCQSTFRVGSPGPFSSLWQGCLAASPLTQIRGLRFAFGFTLSTLGPWRGEVIWHRAAKDLRRGRRVPGKRVDH